MEWTEPQEIAIARAKLINSIENRPLNIALSAIGFGLIPALGMPVATFIELKKVLWDVTLYFTVVFMIIGVLLHLYDHWHRPLKSSIALDSQSLTLKHKRTLRHEGITKTFKYDEFVGFSIFDLPDGKLLAFGEREGRNLSIGIPLHISLDEIRKLLSGKLTELSNEEMPKPRNPYKR